MKISFILIWFVAFAAIPSAQSWTPGDAEIAKLEASVKLDRLPYWNVQHLPPLSGYTRYYAGSTLNGEQAILGELVVPLGSNQHPGIRIVAAKREFPTVSDGGCAIVNLLYSVKEQRIIHIQCNGRA